VKWKGYNDTYNQWIPSSDFHDLKVISDYHANLTRAREGGC
jgi:hypothetical protein